MTTKNLHPHLNQYATADGLFVALNINQICSMGLDYNSENQILTAYYYHSDNTAFLSVMINRKGQVIR